MTDEQLIEAMEREFIRTNRISSLLAVVTPVLRRRVLEEAAQLVERQMTEWMYVAPNRNNPRDVALQIRALAATPEPTQAVTPTCDCAGCSGGLPCEMPCNPSPT